MNPHMSRQAKRLYVGNIPPNIVEGELSEFFNTAMFAAGVTKEASQTPVAAVQFNRDKGFAFLDFQHAEDATAGMAFDGITLHNYSLKVRRPRDFKSPEEEAAEKAAQEQQQNSQDTTLLRNPTALNFLNTQMPIPAAAALVQLNITDDNNPTRILQLFNIASITELQDDENFQYTLDDVTKEAKRYGNVLSVFMVKPPPPDPEGRAPPHHSWCVGRTFVEYTTKEEAAYAHSKLGGRKFNNRMVLVGYFPEEKYAKQQFRPVYEEEQKYLAEVKERVAAEHAKNPNPSSKWS